MEHPLLQNLLKITLIVLCLVSQAYAQGVTPVKPVVGSTWIIGDGSGPLTVDGTVAATQSGTWNITNVSGTVSLPTGAATAANQDGIIKDGAGDTTQANVSSGSLHVACQSGCSGGTQYTEDAAAASDPVGTANILIRSDTPGAVASTNGDNVAQRGTNYGAAFVQVVDSSGNFINTFGGSGGTSSNFGSAVPSAGTAVGFTDGTNMVMGRVVTSAPSAGDAGLVVRNISSTTIATGSAVPASASFIAGTDGTNARALKTDTGGELQVDVLSLPAIPTGSNTIGALVANQSVNVAQINGVTPFMGAGNTGTGSHRVTEATDSQLSAGVGATGDSAATAGSTGSLTAKLRLMTSQLDTISTNVASLLTSSQLVDDDQTGASMHHRVSVGTTEDEHEIKGSAGRLFSIHVTNTNAAARYLRCANQVIGSTTPGTTTVWFGMAIPAATTGAGFTTTFGPAGVAFSTGLTCWLVTGAAETDVAEVAANEINVNYTYK